MDSEINISKPLQKIFTTLIFILFAKQFFSITIKYFEFVSASRITLKSNEHDDNYPSISIAFKESFFSRISDIYDLINNLTIYDEYGIKIDYKPERYAIFNTPYGVEYSIDKLNITQNNLLNRKLFYQRYWNKSDISMKHFCNYSTRSFSIGYYIEQIYNEFEVHHELKSTSMAFLSIHNNYINKLNNEVRKARKWHYILCSYSGIISGCIYLDSRPGVRSTKVVLILVLGIKIKMS